MRFTPFLLAVGAATAAVTIQTAPPDPVAEVADEVFEDALQDVHASVLAGELRAKPRPIEDPWVARTQHYEVHACRGRHLAAWAAQSLEAQLGWMQGFLESGAPDEPFQVRIYPDLASYNALGEEYDARSSITGAFFANRHQDGFVATYESDNYNVMLENLAYGAFLQYADFLAPDREVAVALEQAMASYFASIANAQLGQYRLEQFEAIRDGAEGAAPWTPVPALLLMSLDGFAADGGGDGVTLGRARRTQLAQLVRFLFRHHPETRTTEDGPGLFRDYVARTFRGEDTTDHPLLDEFMTAEKLIEIDGALREFRGWRR